jgi:serine/threonine protein kinase
MDDETLTNHPGDNQGASRTTPLRGSSSSANKPLPKPAEEEDLSGSTLGSYRLVRKIAEGGMGQVYEAMQTKLDRKVALKILTDRLARRPEFMQRFEREAKAAAALNHPNLVQVHDFGESDGRLYLIMEYIEGQDLSARVAQMGRLPVAEALNVIEQAALALKAAHDKSIIHRDIKPANLLRTSDGRIKVSDLGLAKVLTDDSDLTATGAGMGSPHFLAPEQASDASQVDHRADIYSLGITLFFLVTGKRPYEGPTAYSVVLAHANKPLPSGLELGIELPEEVEAFIQRLTAKNPADRYQSYDALLSDLARVKAGATPTLNSGPAHLTRSRIMMLAGAAALLAVFLGMIFSSALKPGLQQGTNASTKKQTVVSSEPARLPTAEVGPQDSNLRRPSDFGEPDSFGPSGEKGVRGPKGSGKGPPRSEGGARFGRSIQFPAPPPPRPDFSPIPDGPAETMLAKADAYAATNQQAYINIINAYQQVFDKARGTTLAGIADQRINQAIERHQTAMHATLQAYEEKMHAQLKAGKVQDAYEVWRDFPANVRSREVDDEVRRILEKYLPPDFQARP